MFHYYLPAFLLAVLENPDEADMIYEKIIFCFEPFRSDCKQSSSVYWRDWRRLRVRRLSGAQRYAVVAYFQYCITEFDYVIGKKAMIRAIKFLSSNPKLSLLT